KLLASGQPLEFRMWLFPWLTWAVIAFISGALLSMFFIPAYRTEITATGLLTIVIICLGLLTARKIHRTATAQFKRRATA
ncbi:MAG: hypothetical protein ACN6RG_18735, partial [Stenotrophomonas sp.]